MVNKVKSSLNNTKNRIKSIDFNAHWYRRVFHTFGASFLFYYILPDEYWFNLLKFWIPLIIVIFVIGLEFIRIKGIISSSHFFGLRMYEKKRVGSYVFFAVAILILLMFFPQQIAIPCILCASIADPLMGEIRIHLNKKHVIIFGFLICFSLFALTWYKFDLWLILLFGFLGSLGAVIGETKKFWWLDDDFMIQMVPAILLLILWLILQIMGFDISLEPIIYPSVW